MPDALKNPPKTGFWRHTESSIRTHEAQPVAQLDHPLALPRRLGQDPDDLRRRVDLPGFQVELDERRQQSGSSPATSRVR